MLKSTKTRQRVRRVVIIFMFLLFPITMNYLSPYVIIDGASQGTANGSLFMFAGMFVSSLFLGRLWCGWAYPAGGLGEIAFLVNNKPVQGRKIDWIKWLIWVPWISLIVWLLISSGGYHSTNFFLDTVNGISVAGDADRPAFIAYIIYYAVIGLFLTLSLTVGRRAGCHAFCWMAPFMIIGRKIRNFFGWPSLRLQASATICTDCKTCTSNCPMSLDVNGMVQKEAMENSECILCGSCVDGCPAGAIRYRFNSGK
jgi:ferredoxin-type protein NapH